MTQARRTNSVQSERAVLVGVLLDAPVDPDNPLDELAGLMDSGDAIIGDVIMGGYAGGAIRPTQPNFHYFADDLPTAMTSLDRILDVTSGRLFPGHGGPVGHAAVCGWRAARRRMR